MAENGQQKRAFLDFLDQGDYMTHVDTMLKQRRTRLLLSLDELRTFDAELTRQVLRYPADHLPAFEEALREVVASQDPTFAKTQPLSALKVGLQGAFGANHVSPRGLGASLLNAAVCVEGIVTKCTQVRPKVLRSTHYCPATAKFTSKEYRDLASIGGVATGSAYPTKVHGTPTDRRHRCTHGR
jgi:DNA replication licensing factor MCM3